MGTFGSQQSFSTSPRASLNGVLWPHRHRHPRFPGVTHHDVDVACCRDPLSQRQASGSSKCRCQSCCLARCRSRD
eukprot:7434108-Alexandrium_andersonii.AAC.1